MKRYESLLKEIESRRLSLDEARLLETREIKNKRFIALISPYDGRFSYYPQAEVDPEEWKKAWALKGTARDRATKMLYEKAARKVLDRLAESVRDYIAWSRVHGAL